MNDLEKFYENIRTIVREYLNEEKERLKILAEIPLLDMEWCRKYIRENYAHALNEMARVNVGERWGFFPTNKFNVFIYSNDHNPPHMHVIIDGWDLVVGIKDGKILKVKHEGKSSKYYSYVEKFTGEWLDSPSSAEEGLTNREVAMRLWDKTERAI